MSNDCSLFGRRFFKITDSPSRRVWVQGGRSGDRCPFLIRPLFGRALAGERHHTRSQFGLLVCAADGLGGWRQAVILIPLLPSRDRWSWCSEVLLDACLRKTSFIRQQHNSPPVRHAGRPSFAFVGPQFATLGGTRSQECHTPIRKGARAP